MITISTEIVWLLIGGLLTAILALIGALIIVVNAVKKAGETNIRLNDEMQENSKTRQAQAKVINDYRQNINLLEARLQAQEIKLGEIEILKTRGKNQTARIEVLEREAEAMKNTIAELTAALTTAQKQLANVEAREHQLSLDLANAREKIAVLERDNMTKDAEIKKLKERVDELDRALQFAQAERERLQQERDDLLRQLQAIEVIPPSVTEPGEAAPQAPETKQEESNDGSA